MELPNAMSLHQFMPCMYCDSKDFGGETFIGLDNKLKKICWRDDCKAKLKQEKSRQEYKAKIKLKADYKCFFDELLDYCGAPIVRGETFCANHLAQRCVICGLQAVKLCKYRGWEDCLQPLCDHHRHAHSGHP